MKHINESKKLVKEGAGAAYTVTLKDIELEDVKVTKKGDEDWEFEAKIVRKPYMVVAEDYYNRFCPVDKYSEEWVEVGGIARGVCWWFDDEETVRQEVSDFMPDVSFTYGHGWSHVNLPEDGKISTKDVSSTKNDFYEIQGLELDAPELSQVVNWCHEHFLDEEEGDEDEEYDDPSLQTMANELSESVNESYNDEWTEVGAAFDEFRQRLWKYTRRDRENRMKFFQDCMQKCEDALKEYHDICVAED